MTPVSTTSGKKWWTILLLAAPAWSCNVLSRGELNSFEAEFKNLLSRVLVLERPSLPSVLRFERGGAGGETGKLHRSPVAELGLVRRQLIS